MESKLLQTAEKLSAGDVTYKSSASVCVLCNVGPLLVEVALFSDVLLIVFDFNIEMNVST